MPSKFGIAMRRLAALLFILGVWVWGPALRAQDLPTIKIAAPPNDTVTSALYALKSGMFKRAGLNVELDAMASGAATAAAVAGGAVAFGNSSLITLIEAHAKHVPFTLVATSGMIETNVPYAAFVVRKDAPFKTARDLNGKTIATPALRDLNAISIMAWVDRNGGDSSTLHFIELSATATLAAIADGRVDAGILGTPILTQGLETGQIRVFAKAFDAVAKRFIHIGWFTTEDYAAKNRDVVERFARVMHDAAVYCNAHQSETVDMIAEFGKLDPTVVRRMARVTFAEYLTAPEIQPLVDVAAKYKVIDHDFNAAELISPYALKPPSRGR
jgi:NitT/TauT family transport system substrate-binding protein